MNIIKTPNKTKPKLIPVILALCLFAISCSTTGLGHISIKKEKDKITGELKEYRSIKIHEDEENDYFLKIKIPDGYEQYSAIFSKENFIYEFSGDDEDRHYMKRSIFTIGQVYSKSPKDSSLSKYTDIVDSYFTDKIKPYFRSRNNDNWDKIENWKPKSISIFYENECPDTQAICFSKEIEVRGLRIFEGKSSFWTVEYIAPILFLPAYKDQEEKTRKMSKEVIENCCEILAVKKLKYDQL